jgi:5-methyltetrahydrofolate--homocysteine methyltransferase
MSRLPEGDDPLAALLCLQELGIAAYGLSGPFEEIEPLIKQFSAYGKLPFLAVPAMDRPPKVWKACIRWLLEAGVRAIGVGARERAYHEAVWSLFPRYGGSPPKYPGRPESAPILLADSRAAYYLDEDFTLSRPIACTLDMTEAILAAEAEPCDALLFLIEGIDCAEHFALNLPFLQKAACLLAHDAPALEHCLNAYPGRAMVDARSEIEEDELNRIAGAYGAVIR